MIHRHPASLSLAELRHRLTARADNPKQTDDLDPVEVLRYFIALPASSHTADSAEALLQLTRMVDPGLGPGPMLQSALLASQIAGSIGDRLLLGRASFKRGLALTRLGRFTEAMGAQVETWSFARELKNKNLELQAVWGFSSIFVAMGQWHTAIRFCRHMHSIAEELGHDRFNFIARNNLADCALQLRDPALALPTLLKLAEDAPHSDLEPNDHAHLHNNLTRAWLLVGDIAAAKFHAEQAADAAAVWGTPNVVHCVEAVRGLVDVRLGMVDDGLSAVKRALDFALRANQTEVPDCLGICLDAHEAAGNLDEALVYLHELVAWKKRSIDSEAIRQPQDLAESLKPEAGAALDDGLLTKVQSLRARSESRVERLLEIAINAEIASGNDLYRPFRIGNLARRLAEALRWDQERTVSLVRGAQLCRIGMIAIPARILVKPGRLSEGENQVLHGYAAYGAELLGKSKLQILEMATVIAEQHAEKYDGSGYPSGLVGESIAEEARLVAVCIAFDAMTHKRPWRRTPLSVQAALSELKRQAGVQFDPSFVTTLNDVFERELSACNNLDALLSEGANEFEYVRTRARVEVLIAES